MCVITFLLVYGTEDRKVGVITFLVVYRTEDRIVCVITFLLIAFSNLFTVVIDVSDRFQPKELQLLWPSK